MKNPKFTEKEKVGKDRSVKEYVAPTNCFAGQYSIDEGEKHTPGIFTKRSFEIKRFFFIFILKSLFVLKLIVSVQPFVKINEFIRFYSYLEVISYVHKSFRTHSK